MEKLYCKEYTCSKGYDYKDGYEGILCDDECDDSRCCDEGDNPLYSEARFDEEFKFCLCIDAYPSFSLPPPSNSFV